MKSMLERVDHVIECRDSRVPATSINPVFEEVLGEKRRDIVYTKRDLINGLGRDAQSVSITIFLVPKLLEVYMRSSTLIPYLISILEAKFDHSLGAKNNESFLHEQNREKLLGTDSEIF